MSAQLDVAYEQACELQRRLREAWAYAREQWTDSVSVEFEQVYWDELEAQLSKFLNAADDLLSATRTSR